MTVPLDLLGHLGDISAFDIDCISIVVAEGNGGTSVALSADAGAAPGTALVPVDPLQLVDAVVQIADVSSAPVRVAVAILGDCHQ